MHAHDVYMGTLLQRLLRWLGALSCPVVLLSATLPRQKRQELLEAYADGRAALAGRDRPYTRLSVLKPGSPPTLTVVHVPASAQKTLRVVRQADAPAGLAAALTSALRGGGGAAVVRNTVRQAQETYRALAAPGRSRPTSRWSGSTRFLFGRRQEIEQGVLRRYGKQGPRPPARGRVTYPAPARRPPR